MENDPRDVVLMPGMSFEIDRSGRMIIAAEDDSRFCLRSDASAPNRVVAWLAHQAAWLSMRWFGRHARHPRRFAAPYY